MVISAISNYEIANKSLSFGAKTRSEREAEKEKSYTRMVNVVMPEEDLQTLELAKKRAREKRLEEERRRKEVADAQKSERQYKEDVKELRETKQMISDITNKVGANGSLMKNIGKAADIIITGVLSGMALHWSTGKAYMMLHNISKKPKVVKTMNNIKRPFQIVGSSIAEGASTAWASMAKKVKATEKGQKFINSKPMQAINDGLDEIAKTYKNIKKDAKALKTDDIRSGIATVFGVSGFTAGVVEKIDTPTNSKKD